MLLLVLFLLHLPSSISAAQPTSDASRDLQVLLHLRSSLSVTPSTRGFESWTPSVPPCNFSFVTCDPDLHVVSIDLTRTAVNGTLPFRSLCQLPRLSFLSAASNHLRGPLTPDLRNCTSLTFLDLSSNDLTGPIPDLSPLSRLRVLNLSKNGFTDAVPSFGNLTDLVHLLVGDIPFHSFPFPLDVLRLPKLSYLYLSNCSLTGEIPPGIGNLTSLDNLELSWNNLTGAIPTEIGKLTILWGLQLYRNSLTGNFPAGFGNLTNLRNFDGSRNSLEGNLSEIKTLKKLQTLHLHLNNFSGEVPAELGEFSSLVDLSLYSNRISGVLPRGLGSSSKFQYIDVSTNNLTGPIPPCMCQRGRMKMLLMLENRFTGDIPAAYGCCRTMVRLRVNDNELTGEVPEGIWSLPNAHIIDLARNRLSGKIPAGIGKAKVLKKLFIAGNEFAGEIPKEIGEAVSLVEIDAASNRLSGTVPAEVGELKKLNSLVLRGNELSGEIPPSISSSDLLAELDLSSNNLSGKIPAEIGGLRVLNILNLSGNGLSGGVPSALSTLKLSSLDLSGNCLRGPVPKALEISAFNSSFLRNPGLCGGKIILLRRCCSASLRCSDHLRAIFASVVAVAAILLVSVGFFIILRRRRATAATKWDVKPFHVISFDEKEIVNGVVPENLISRGGSGSVYRVRLRDGSTVAVKQIRTNVVGEGSRRGGRGKGEVATGTGRRMFEAEVGTLSSIRHVGVVKLYCSITGEGGARLLVYEYLRNGSLWERLHGEGNGERSTSTSNSNSLGWKERYDVALGAARALEYLHHGCERPILHRDIKSSNILLDEELKPRIADFGLAKILRGERASGERHEAAQEDACSVVAGTHGYIAPEYAYTRKVNDKSDVYSFGVVLMELVTGLKPIESRFGDNKSIVHWVYSKMSCKDEVLSLLDLKIPKESEEEAIKVLKVGVLCTARLPRLRPSIRVVVQMLEDAAI